MSKNLQKLNQEENEQLWAKRVLTCRESGLSVAEWCDENNIKPHTFYSWQRKLFKKAQIFTEISVAEEEDFSLVSNLSKIIATVTINDLKVEIHAGSDPMDIENLIRGLKSC